MGFELSEVFAWRRLLTLVFGSGGTWAGEVGEMGSNRRAGEYQEVATRQKRGRCEDSAGRMR